MFWSLRLSMKINKHHIDMLKKCQQAVIIHLEIASCLYLKT